MEYLSQEDLESRTRDIITNMMTLSDKGQISLHGLNDVGEYWMIKWTHVLEEFQIRYGPYPNGFTNGFLKKASIVNPSFPSPPKAKDAIEKIGGIPDGALFKFGKAEHLDDMYRKGSIRIAPASYYDDPSLNSAIRDDELSFTVQAKPESVQIKNNKGDEIKPKGNVSFTIESTTNYYVSCFAQKYTFREYDDFEADACIVIREPGIFIERMIHSLEAGVSDFTGYAAPVKYIDPLVAKSKDVEVFISKHFRYAYQNEFRIIWLPEKQVKKLDALFINIGSMEDYSDIIHV
ncbi:hypothetical protein [uncultured Amphritea sp.]|uniref:hypothetical protein n=1 Tax=uncultured Amphritea sp. TaxID=981605 RepID=UPI00261E8DBC|nr:hypothetical protein [uncultured Amphritea sp.]